MKGLTRSVTMKENKKLKKMGIIFDKINGDSDGDSDIDFNYSSAEEFDEEFDDFVDNNQNYKSKINYYDDVSRPIMVVFFNYVNMLSHNKNNLNNSVVDDVKFEGILDNGNTFIDYLPDYPPTTFKYTAILGIKNGNSISVVFNAFIEGNQLRNVIRISSMDVDTSSSEAVYDILFDKAVKASNLKGSYLTIGDENLTWKVNELKDISFDDVFLPQDLMDDLVTYTKLFESKKILQRFMFSGVPGTGKTESTRAISKILNNAGVTVIKTNICKIIKQKFELAKILAPCIIILDDIDLYLGDRNSSGVSPLLGAFLDILDGVDKLPDDVGVIASTNAPHLIDLAAQRPGRFNKVLFFDELTSENIVNIITKSLHSMNKKYNNVSKKDIKILTGGKLIDFFKSSGVTGAFIHEKVQEIKNKSEIMELPLDLDKIILEITKRNGILDKKLRKGIIENKLSSRDKKIGY